MKEIKTSQAVGQALCHDIVRIVIGQTKETAFKRGHVIRQEDVEAHLQFGRGLALHPLRGGGPCRPLP